MRQEEVYMHFKVIIRIHKFQISPLNGKTIWEDQYSIKNQFSEVCSIPTNQYVYSHYCSSELSKENEI